MTAPGSIGRVERIVQVRRPQSGRSRGIVQVVASPRTSASNRASVPSSAVKVAPTAQSVGSRQWKSRAGPPVASHVTAAVHVARSGSTRRSLRTSTSTRAGGGTQRTRDVASRGGSV